MSADADWRVLDEQPLDNWLTAYDRADMGRSGTIEGFALRSELDGEITDVKRQHAARLRRVGRARGRA